MSNLNFHVKRFLLREMALRVWLIELTGKRIDPSKPLWENLSDGVILCHAMLAIKPRSIPKIEEKSKLQFKLRENVMFFIEAFNECNIPKFGASCGIHVDDIFRLNNPLRLMESLESLARYAESALGCDIRLKEVSELVNEAKRTGETIKFRKKEWTRAQGIIQAALTNKRQSIELMRVQARNRVTQTAASLFEKNDAHRRRLQNASRRRAKIDHSFSPVDLLIVQQNAILEEKRLEEAITEITSPPREPPEGEDIESSPPSSDDEKEDEESGTENKEEERAKDAEQPMVTTIGTLEKKEEIAEDGTKEEEKEEEDQRTATAELQPASKENKGEEKEEPATIQEKHRAKEQQEEPEESSSASSSPQKATLPPITDDDKGTSKDKPTAVTENTASRDASEQNSSPQKKDRAGKKSSKKSKARTSRRKDSIDLISVSAPKLLVDKSARRREMASAKEGQKSSSHQQLQQKDLSASTNVAKSKRPAPKTRNQLRSSTLRSREERLMHLKKAAGTNGTTDKSGFASLRGKSVVEIYTARVEAKCGSPESFAHFCRGVVLLQARVRGILARKAFAKRVRDAAYRERVAKEILETEKDFINSLDTLLEEYLKPMYEDQKLAVQLGINQDKLKPCYNGLQVIRNYNATLLTKLEPRVNDWSPASCLGDIFMQISFFLKTYSQYVKDYTVLLNELSSWKQSSAKFRMFLEEHQAKSGGQTITAFLVMPVQRIPRYNLLLKELYKHTDRMHKDFSNISKAYEQVQSVAEYVDQRAKEAENKAAVLEIQTRFVGKFETIMAPHRRFVREGKLTVVDENRNVKKGKQRTVFLFTDIIVETKALRREKLKKREKRVNPVRFKRIFSFKELRPVQTRDGLGIALHSDWQYTMLRQVKAMHKITSRERANSTTEGMEDTVGGGSPNGKNRSSSMTESIVNKRPEDVPSVVRFYFPSKEEQKQWWKDTKNLYRQVREAEKDRDAANALLSPKVQQQLLSEQKKQAGGTKTTTRSGRSSYSVLHISGSGGDSDKKKERKQRERNSVPVEVTPPPQAAQESPSGSSSRLHSKKKHRSRNGNGNGSGREERGKRGRSKSKAATGGKEEEEEEEEKEGKVAPNKTDHLAVDDEEAEAITDNNKKKNKEEQQQQEEKEQRGERREARTRKHHHRSSKKREHTKRHQKKHRALSAKANQTSKVVPLNRSNRAVTEAIVSTTARTTEEKERAAEDSSDGTPTGSQKISRSCSNQAIVNQPSVVLLDHDDDEEEEEEGKVKKEKQAKEDEEQETKQKEDKEKEKKDNNKEKDKEEDEEEGPSPETKKKRRSRIGRKASGLLLKSRGKARSGDNNNDTGEVKEQRSPHAHKKKRTRWSPRKGNGGGEGGKHRRSSNPSNNTGGKKQSRAHKTTSSPRGDKEVEKTTKGNKKRGNGSDKKKSKNRDKSRHKTKSKGARRSAFSDKGHQTLRSRRRKRNDTGKGGGVTRNKLPQRTSGSLISTSKARRSNDVADQAAVLGGE